MILKTHRLAPGVAQHLVLQRSFAVPAWDAGSSLGRLVHGHGLVETSVYGKGGNGCLLDATLKIFNSYTNY